MLVYECSDNFPKHHLNYTGMCYSSNMPPAIEECAGITAIAAWAIGGKVSKYWHTTKMIVMITITLFISMHVPRIKDL